MKGKTCKSIVSLFSIFVLLLSAVVPVSAVTSNTSVSSLVTDVTEIYSFMSDTQKGTVETARSAVAGLTDTEISTILKENGITQAKIEAYPSLIGLARDIAELGYVDGANLQAKIDAIRNNSDYTSTFDTLFSSELTVDDMIAFLVALKEKLITEIGNNIFQILLGETDFDSVVASAATDLSTTTYSEFDGKLQTGLGIGVVDLIAIKDGIEAKLDANGDIAKNAKAALLAGALESLTKDSNTGGGSYVPAPTPSPEPSADGAAEVELSDDAVSTETDTDGTVKTTVKVDTASILNLINTATDLKTVSITVPDDDSNAAVVSVPSSAFSALKDKNEDAVVTINSKTGSYSLGVKEINVEALAASLGASSTDDVEISIEITQSEDTTNAVASNGLAAASEVVDFKITAKAGTDESEVNNFNSYVARSIPLTTTDVNPSQYTAVRINADGTLTAVPTKIVDGKAVFSSRTNSKYAVVKNNVTFTDVEAGDWAAPEITKLGNKLIINGKEDGRFAPAEGTNRIQMTILLVKALGLTASGEYDGSFTDVEGDEWFIEPLVAAVEAGIIKGRVDGSFDPYAKVNRSQSAAMLARALEFTGYDVAKLDKSKSINQFDDVNSIGDWSKADVELMLEAGIFSGRNNGTIFDPAGTTSRAQTAVVLNGYLKFVDFIN
ncbi:S-layer homology domain-containing protein [Aquibacillus salsiterrae]|uniref:S-layer homology domain-containing protein n=1 Tax=Aquibacillus salsiterrae TaxID=2950439 RepID=A0A9X4AED8_9BACI|nr:S-layer homology domain-containing protein [Aquibacillus salsiterrae]MDC3416651.1 S-layer homology domain-containing protein [Aquibacillus salsiterrae]